MNALHPEIAELHRRAAEERAERSAPRTPEVSQEQVEWQVTVARQALHVRDRLPQVWQFMSRVLPRQVPAGLAPEQWAAWTLGAKSITERLEQAIENLQGESHV